MARLDTRILSESIPPEWLKSDTPVPINDFEGDPAEIREREWRMIVAFLNNC